MPATYAVLTDCRDIRSASPPDSGPGPSVADHQQLWLQYRDKIGACSNVHAPGHREPMPPASSAAIAAPGQGHRRPGPEGRARVALNARHALSDLPQRQRVDLDRDPPTCLLATHTGTSPRRPNLTPPDRTCAPRSSAAACQRPPLTGGQVQERVAPPTILPVELIRRLLAAVSGIAGVDCCHYLPTRPTSSAVCVMLRVDSPVVTREAFFRCGKISRYYLIYAFATYP